MTEQGSMERFLNIFSSNRDDKTSRLAKEFYERVRSGRFTWIGLGETADVLNRRRLVIYLVEGSTTPQIPQQSISDSFVPLSLNIRSRQEFLDLYHLSSRRNKSLAESAIEAMNATYSSPNHNYQPNSKLLFEETIIPPVFY